MKKRATCALLVVLGLVLAAGSAYGVKKKKKAPAPAAATVEAQGKAKAEPAVEGEPGAEPAEEAKAEPSEQDLEQAKTRYEEGKRHFEAGAFDQALAAFTEAYNLSNKPDLLFNLAVCSEKLGQFDKAIAFYERYVGRPWWVRTIVDAWTLGSVLERLGQLHDEQGELESAAVYYAQFVDLWSEADPEVQPRVEAAQTRLQEIVRERG